MSIFSMSIVLWERKIVYVKYDFFTVQLSILLTEHSWNGDILKWDVAMYFSMVAPPMVPNLTVAPPKNHPYPLPLLLSNYPLKSSLKHNVNLYFTIPSVVSNSYLFMTKQGDNGLQCAHLPVRALSDIGVKVRVECIRVLWTQSQVLEIHPLCMLVVLYTHTETKDIGFTRIFWSLVARYPIINVSHQDSRITSL